MLLNAGDENGLPIEGISKCAEKGTYISTDKGN